jgi:hypothetical protein
MSDEPYIPPGHLTGTLAMVRQEFEEQWPRADEAIPGPSEGRTSDVVFIERESWWRQRADAESLVWAFAVRAPLMDRATLAVDSNEFLAAIRDKAIATMEALVERRPDPPSFGA